MMNTQINIKPGDKIKLYSYKKALKIGEENIRSYMKSEELMSNLSDDDKLQYLPKEVFGKSHTVLNIEIEDTEYSEEGKSTRSEIIYVIKSKGCEWFVSEIFVKKERRKEKLN